MRKIAKTLIAASIATVFMASVPLVFAAPQNNDVRNAGQTGHAVQNDNRMGNSQMGSGAMGRGMTGGGMTGSSMMPMMQMMREMNRMMATCTQKMQGHTGSGMGMKDKASNAKSPTSPLR